MDDQHGDVELPRVAPIKMQQYAAHQVWERSRLFRFLEGRTVNEFAVLGCILGLCYISRLSIANESLGTGK